MSIRIYRVEVLGWPTDDGQPWERFYGTGAHYYDDHGVPDVDYDPLPPSWVLALRDNPQVADRFRIDDDGEVSGVVMPKVNRRHYLSASGAHKLAADMRAFGAVVRVVASNPVTWPDA